MIVDEYLADVPCEEGVPVASSDSSRGNSSRDVCVLAALLKREQSIHVERIGGAVVNCGGDAEIAADVYRALKRRLIVHLCGSEAKIFGRLERAEECTSPVRVLIPEQCRVLT